MPRCVLGCGEAVEPCRSDSCVTTAHDGAYTVRVSVRIVMVLLVAILTGCNSGGLPGFAGETCSRASDCNSGFQCLEYSTPVDGGCASMGTVCLQPCLTSSDCAGTGFGCYASCGGPTVCQPAPVMPDGGGD